MCVNSVRKCKQTLQPTSTPVLQRLKRQYDQSEEKLSEFRDKLRDVRAELLSKDRQLDVARRMLARLGSEKNQLEVRPPRTVTSHQGLIASWCMSRMQCMAHGSGCGPRLQNLQATTQHAMPCCAMQCKHGVCTCTCQGGQSCQAKMHWSKP